MSIIRHPRLFVLGIVGHAEDKFTRQTEGLARYEIEKYLVNSKPDRVVSGGCHLGGVDVWAIEIADRLGIPTEEFKPKSYTWASGYKPRNLKIAKVSSRVLCVVVREYPPSYCGMSFSQCYHCKGRNPLHVKSGGCWTAWKCKEREWIII